MFFLIFTLSVIMFVYYKWRKRRMFKLLAKMKMPPGSFLLGNLPMFIGTPSQIFHTINESCYKYGPNFATWLIYFPLIFVSKPEDLETVMQSQSCLSKSFFYDFTKIAVGDGLFSAPVHRWRKTRKIIQPTFNSKILHSFIPIFASTSSICINEILPKYLGKKDVNWYKIFTSTNLDAICQTAMGINTNAQREEFRFGEFLEKGMQIVFIRMTNAYLQFDFLFNCTRLSKKLRECLDFAEGFAYDVLKEKKKIFQEKLKNNINTVVSDDDSVPIKRKAFLDLLFELDHKGMKFSDKNLKDEVLSFFIGGTDTSAITSCFFLTMMGMHQDIQEKVYEEIISVLGHDRIPDMEDFVHLNLLERCLKETMRLFSPAPYISRAVEGKEVVLSDCTLPVGSVLILPIFYVHRNPEYWKDPLKFDPDRFLPENIEKRHPFSFIPFSGGLRGCVGMRYSYMNLKMLQSMILRKYRIHCDYYTNIEDIKVKNNIVLRPVDGFKFYLEERK